MIHEAWVVTAAANAVMVVAYGTIAALILGGIARGSQWTTNPIAVATAAVFVTCTLGHGHHLFHALFPETVREAPWAYRAFFADGRLVAWDAATALVAGWYFLLRNRLPIITGGAALCADMEKRQRDAAELNADVVVGLEQSKSALASGDRDTALRTLTETLAASREIVTSLLGASGSPGHFRPGGLRRREAS